MRPGKQICLADGKGHTAVATVTAVKKSSLTAELAAVQFTPRTGPGLTLAFAVPRANRADWLLEHATEIGVHRFVPLLTERSRPQGLRTERWRKIVLAAAGQCARPWLPEVLEPTELGHWLTTDLPTHKLLADAAGDQTPSLGADQEAALLIGPEGGLTDDEQLAARQRGFHRVRFAPHILRTETAALAGAAILLAGAQ